MTPDEARAFYPRNPPGLAWEPVYCPPPEAPPPMALPVAPPRPPARPRRERRKRLKIDGQYIRISQMSGNRPMLRVWLSWSVLAMLPGVQRVGIHRHDETLILEPVERGGWAIAPPRKRSHARCVICNSAAPLLRGYDGAYRARVERGRVVVGERIGA